MTVGSWVKSPLCWFLQLPQTFTEGLRSGCLQCPLLKVPPLKRPWLWLLNRDCSGDAFSCGQELWVVLMSSSRDCSADVFRTALKFKIQSYKPSKWVRVLGLLLYDASFYQLKMVKSTIEGDTSLVTLAVAIEKRL
ncbi:hypothetical protein MHYP_G00126080 [Metynnis hypsauchen]